MLQTRPPGSPVDRAGFAARVEIALPVPVDTLFHYGVPAALAADAVPGRRARVPFGARRATGLIVARSDAPAPGGAPLRAIESVIDPAPVVSPDLIEVLVEAAADAYCPVGLALACATPSGSAPRAAPGFALTPRGHEALARGAVAREWRPLLAALAGGPRPRSWLARRFRGAEAALRLLARDGLLATASVDAAAARPPRERIVTLADPTAAPGEAAATLLARAPRQAALLRTLAARGPTEQGALVHDEPGAAAALRALARRGLVRVEERALVRGAAPALLADGEPTAPALVPEQQAALDAIAAAVRARRPERFLLHGVTGSGKTEVYLRAIAEALALGRQVLVLVPEITLTHQLVARLQARFGDRVAVLHSALRPGERIAEWRRLLAGSTPIAVGARSALFAPLDDLGLVVIDEEQESAYKNEEGFRYHARDLAARRAAAAGCPLVLGSATPSLETRFAAERGALRRLVLPHRIGGRPLPEVELVDLNAERAALPRGRKLVLSRALRAALADTLAAGGQAILFLNRRGFSTRVFCFSCGHAETCRHCEVSLVFHAGAGKLRCHYCDYAIDPPDACSGCGAPESALLGIGTERLEEEVRTRFPAARIARLDRDTAARRGETERVLGALATGRVDVLIGTQMVAKGHHFPGVRLVGVVAADQTLHFPDFRAAERTFQLLTQVAGRAGRGEAPGRVLVQTFAPDHYAIAPVRHHDYEAFYRAELAHRDALAYPPCGALVHALVSGPDEAEAQAQAARLVTVARRAAGLPDDAGAPPAAGGARGPALEVLGPAPAPLARLRDRFRFQLVVKGRDAKAVHEAGRALARAAAALEREARHLRASVDPHPVNML
ncbi:MAG: primosomal protein N' [Deltaproteobacteria bacterium]|nr:primosomal protein N' [Deltaproteobacteria bacterium]